MENKKYKISKKKIEGPIANAFCNLRDDIVSTAESLEANREMCIDGAKKLVSSKEYDAFESGIAFTLSVLNYYTQFGELPKTRTLVYQASHLVTSSRLGMTPEDTTEFLDEVANVINKAVKDGIKKAIEDGAE